ncbi:DUF393 domain-containing protein [Candidatus Poribacteria bacterium]|nr:DUF393 domain-containing protein [Candidatus Poribacteria bacterium]MBT5534993.1 DUF393 domain-containing protein [Candidatus Poribacteria bacterium]MBT5713882.1 DUF393 domain-containing protein [Candidatus Poribacteria bacterium]MBT7100334.1 DUF393 domain-containing protein [Candidatus Poribacteria bacterium]MBT7809532.1 DUF393 domain-containing protein [Candidatus Poribacteria bacterium]
MRGVVVFDGDCSFCQGQIRRMRRLTIPGRFEFVARQTDGLEDRFPMLRADEFSTGMRYVAEDGAVSVGADAVYQVARGMRYVRRITWLYRVPGARLVARAMYGWVARNRQRLGPTTRAARR